MRFALILLSTMLATAAHAAPKTAAKPVKPEPKGAAPKAVATPATEDAEEQGEAKPEAGKAAIPSFVALGEIDSEADETMTNVTVRLDAKPQWANPGEVQDHGSFLQVILPDVLVPEPGKFIESASPYIKKIAVFQLNQKDAGVRFFVAADAALTKQATTVALLDKRVVLTVDHEKMKALLPAPAGSAAAVIAKTEVRNDIPPPSELVKKDAVKAAPGVDLRDKLTSAAIFSGGMLVLLALSLMLKPYIRRRQARVSGTPEQQVSMKTLANLPLAARQRLQLIQIGDEKILIGVTPDSINYITTVGGKAAYNNAAPTPIPRTFGKLIEDATAAEALEMRARPVLKNIEGNDEASLRRAARDSTPRLPARDKAEERRPVRNERAEREPERAPARERLETRADRQDREEREERAAERERPRPTRASRVNIAVGDDGARDLNRRQDDGVKEPGGVDDVTRLIREKLKTLRTI